MPRTSEGGGKAGIERVCVVVGWEKKKRGKGRERTKKKAESAAPKLNIV